MTNERPIGYQIAAGKRLSDLRPGQAAIQEKSRVDETDTLISVNPDRYFRQSPPQIVQTPDGTRASISVQAVSLPKPGSLNVKPR